MRLLFIVPFDYPTRYAHPLHGLFLARSFKEILGDKFTFITNSVEGDQVKDLEDNIVTVFGNLSKLFAKLHARSVLIFFWFIYKFITKGVWRGKDVYLYINDPRLAIILIFLKKIFRQKIIFECHGIYSPFIERIIYNNIDVGVFVNKKLEKRILERFNYMNSKTIVAPNAARVDDFKKITLSKHEIKERLGLPKDKKIITYVGRLRPLGYDKGIEYIYKSLTGLPKNIIFLCVGGIDGEIEEYNQKAVDLGISERVILVPYVSSDKVPLYCKASDILAYVPIEKNDFFEIETSPMKLFEYMASNVPIIVSNMPTFREILNDNEAYIIDHATDHAFINAVEKIMSDEVEANNRARRSFEKITHFTWEKRMRNVLSFIESHE